MTGERVPTTETAQIQRAWRSVHQFFPDWYDEEVMVEGWVRPDRDKLNATQLRARVPSPFYKRWIAHVLKTPPEEYTWQYRYAEIGQFPYDEAYFRNMPDQGFPFARMPARLAIRDSVFLPINPLDGNRSPVLHTRVLFHTDAWTTPQGHPRTRGLQFSFLQTPEDPQLPDPMMGVRYHQAQEPPLETASIDAFLAAHDFAAPPSALPLDRRVELLRTCILEAEASIG